MLPVNTRKIEISGNESVEVFSDNNKYMLPELNETSFNWSFPDDVSLEGETDTNLVFLNWGSTAGYVIVNISNSCGVDNDSIYVDIVEQLPFPDPNTRQQIPGTLNAINFDVGGEGFAYHDSDPENQGNGLRQDEGVDTEYNDGGQNIGWIEPGEWVEYSVDVESTALYNIELRVASLYGGGQMEIHFNGEDRTGQISIPITSSWTSFTSIYLNDIQLFDTDSLMRLNFVVGDFNISRLIFNDASTSVYQISKNLIDIKLIPNPANSFIRLVNQKETLSYNIINLLGEVVQTGIILPDNVLDVSNLNKGYYILNLNNNNKASTLKFIKL
mgnify:CR=1 FL=1